MKSVIEIIFMSAVISPLFPDPKPTVIIAIILSAIFIYLTHRKNGGRLT